MTFLDTKLYDDLADSWEKFSDFEEYTRDNSQTVSDYIDKFEQKYNKIVKKSMKLHSEILAFKFLKQAGITQEEHMLVLTGMNYTDKATLYEHSKGTKLPRRLERTVLQL